MKFGLFVNNQQPRDTDPVLSFRQCVQQVIAARDTGFDAIASGHHYVSPPFIALQNLPFLARLAADSWEMDLGAGGDPAGAAQPRPDSRGGDRDARRHVGRPRGVRRRHRLPAGGIRRVQPPGRRPGAAHARRAAAHQAAMERGQRHASGALLQPARGDLDDPPGAEAAPARRSGSPPTPTSAVERTGRLGYPWFINPHAASPTIERQWGLYKAALAANGHAIPAARPMILELHVAETREAAYDTARSPISQRNTPPTPPGARTRRCRGRRASACRSPSWRKTASFSAAPTT